MQNYNEKDHIKMELLDDKHYIYLQFAFLLAQQNATGL